MRVPEIGMEALTQTAQAARRYLAHFLMSGDDAARKTLVFSPTNAKKTSLSPSDVNPTPTKSSYEAPASHHDGYSRHTSTVATRGPATGADASRITTRFAREAQVAPPATRKRGAEPMDRDESHRADWNEHPAGDAPHAIPDQSVTASAAFGVGNGHGHGNGNLKIKGILSRGMNVGYRVSVDGGKRRRDLSTEGDADDDTDESRASKKRKRTAELLMAVGIGPSLGNVLSLYTLGNTKYTTGNTTRPACTSGNTNRLPKVQGTRQPGRLRMTTPGVGLRPRLPRPLHRLGGTSGHNKHGRHNLSLPRPTCDRNVLTAELTDLPSDQNHGGTDGSTGASYAPSRSFETDANALPITTPPGLIPGAFSFGDTSSTQPEKSTARRSKSRQGQTDEDDSLLGAALREFNGGKTGTTVSAAPKKRNAGGEDDAKVAAAPAVAFSFGGGSSTAHSTGTAPGGFTFGGSDAAATTTASAPFSFGGAPNVEAKTDAAHAPAPFSFGAAAPAVPAGAPAPFSFGAAPAAAPASAGAPASFTFGTSAAAPSMALGASDAAPAGRKVVRARRPGRR